MPLDCCAPADTPETALEGGPGACLVCIPCKDGHALPAEGTSRAQKLTLCKSAVLSAISVARYGKSTPGRALHSPRTEWADLAPIRCDMAHRAWATCSSMRVRKC